MIDVIQELVESLAQEIQHSVAVDDAGLRLLVSSSHFEDVDQARLGSLVGRRVSGPARDYVLGAGVQRWHAMTKLPANPDAGLDRDRLCFPLRSRYELLGFMWLIDDGNLDERKISIAAETAEQIQELLIRKAHSDVSADMEVESLVLGLLAPEPHDRELTARDVHDLGLFRHASYFSVYVLSVELDEDVRTGDRVADSVRRAFSYVTQGRLRESYAFSVSSQTSILVLGHRALPTAAEMSAFATLLHAELERSNQVVSARATVGIADPVEALEAVENAFGQAVSAAKIARGLDQAVASWASHPLEALLDAALVDQIRSTDLPHAIRVLEGQSEEIQSVVEKYLDNAGNVVLTSEQLHLHRTTVYYRLGRFKELTGLDLDQGEVRLLLHLWFKARPHLRLT